MAIGCQSLSGSGMTTGRRVPTVIGPRSPRLASRSRDRSRELFGIGPRLPVGLTCLGRAAGIGGGDQVLSCRIENLDAVLEQAERPITYVTEDPANRAGLMIMVNDGPLGNNCANRADATLALEHLGLLGRSNAVGSPEVIVGTPRVIRPRRSSLVPLLDAGDAAVLDTTGARAVEVGCTLVLMARGAS